MARLAAMLPLPAVRVRRIQKNRLDTHASHIIGCPVQRICMVQL
jgi:hypothetical protein